MVHAGPRAIAACSHADMRPAPHAPYLPPEVHCIIACHLEFADLPNYRLVSKSCAEIGAPELFRTIAFHCSSASMARVDAIKACEHLNKQLKSLVWDTNMWSIPNVRDYHEWLAYFKRKADLQRAFSRAVKLAPDELLDIANSHWEWQDYLDRIQDESTAKKPRSLQRLFGGFKNLHKLRVVNGQLTRTTRDIKKTDVYVAKPEASALYYRGESLYNNDADRFQRPGAGACTVFQRCQNIPWHLTKLRMDAVHWSVFAHAIDQIPSLQQVLSFHLHITFETEQTGHVRSRELEHAFADAREAFSCHHLMHFLANLPRLQSLKLRLSRAHPLNRETFCRAPSNVSDLFSEHHVWSDLRKLSLSDVDTTCEALLSLLDRHRSTLRVLRLHKVWFEPHNSSLLVSQIAFAMKLPELLAGMHDILDLKRARWSGWLGRTLDEEHQEGIMDTIGWDLDDDRIAPLVARYLVKGGDCPLNETNILERNITDLERGY